MEICRSLFDSVLRGDTTVQDDERLDFVLLAAVRTHAPVIGRDTALTFLLTYLFEARPDQETLELFNLAIRHLLIGVDEGALLPRIGSDLMVRLLTLKRDRHPFYQAHKRTLAHLAAITDLPVWMHHHDAVLFRALNVEDVRTIVSFQFDGQAVVTVADYGFGDATFRFRLGDASATSVRLNGSNDPLSIRHRKYAHAWADAIDNALTTNTVHSLSSMTADLVRGSLLALRDTLRLIPHIEN